MDAMEETVPIRINNKLITEKNTLDDPTQEKTRNNRDQSEAQTENIERTALESQKRPEQTKQGGLNSNAKLLTRTTEKAKS